MVDILVGFALVAGLDMVIVGLAALAALAVRRNG